MRAQVMTSWKYDNMKIIILISNPEFWQQAQTAGEYRRSTLDKTLEEVGFIHATFPDQTMAVIERHFADRSEILLLLVDEDKVKASVKHEAPLSGRGGIYPHIYGALNVDAVYETVLLQKDGTGRFIEPSL